jgi:hypothetical protein
MFAQKTRIATAIPHICTTPALVPLNPSNSGPSTVPSTSAVIRKRFSQRAHNGLGQADSSSPSRIAARTTNGMRSVTSIGGNAEGQATAACPAR